MRFNDQVAVVTGAGSGIGEATAYRLSAEGAHVVLIGRRSEVLESVAAKCAGPTTVLSLDVTVKADIDIALPAVLAQVGAPSIVVHSAGQTIVGALDELTVDEWDRQFDVNLKSIYLLNRHLWPAMEAAGGSIIMVASTASFAAFPQDAAYVASKGAVLALTKAMALDGASVGIRVNAVCPGFILTPNLQGYFDAQEDPEAVARGAALSAPLGRMGTPADVAATISFLASEDAAFVTGASLLVDGGLMAKVPTS